DGCGQAGVLTESAAVALPVHEHVVVKDAVEADVLKSERGDDLGELLLPVRAQGLVGPPRADAPAPHMREHAVAARLTVDAECVFTHRGLVSFLGIACRSEGGRKSLAL